MPRTAVGALALALLCAVPALLLGALDRSSLEVDRVDLGRLVGLGDGPLLDIGTGAVALGAAAVALAGVGVVVLARAGRRVAALFAVAAFCLLGVLAELGYRRWSAPATVPRGTASRLDVADTARRAGRPVFFAGMAFAGLPLTGAAFDGSQATFLYGRCEIVGEGGCPPPAQIQNFEFVEGQWRAAAGCKALQPVRGLPTVRHDGFVVFTRHGVVKIYARSPAEERRVALALVPTDGRSRLEPPPARVREVLHGSCGL